VASLITNTMKINDPVIITNAEFINDSLCYNFFIVGVAMNTRRSNIAEKSLSETEGLIGCFNGLRICFWDYCFLGWEL